MNRRKFLASLGVALCASLLFCMDEDEAQLGRPSRGPARRNLRRRFRRRVDVRIINGRPFWVVPVALAVGWELVHENRVVLVKETRFIEQEGKKVEVVVVQDSVGRTEQIGIIREDTPENTVNLQGSEIPESDFTTPGVE